MAKKRPTARPSADAAAPPAPPLGWRVVAPIVAAAAAAQTVVWIVLWELFGIVRAGYWFFDLSDILGTYYPYALNISRGMAAYRDFFIEYPPLFVPLLVAVGNPVPEAKFAILFALLMVTFMVAAGAVTALAAVDARSAWRPYLVVGVFSALVFALGPISANRYDAVVAFVLALALLLMARGKWELAGVVIGLGFALKITPAMLLPIVLVLAPTRRAVRALASFAVAAVVPFLWVLALGGSSASTLGQMLAYHLTRPLEIESVLATPLWVARLVGTPVTVGLAAGSQVVVSGVADVIAKASALVLLAALGATFWLVWRRRQTILAEPRFVMLASLATMLASLVGSKVLSPQYFVWIVPAVALVAVDRRLLGGLLGMALLLTQVLFPANYWAFALRQLEGPILLVVVRNLLVVAAFALSLWHLWTLPERPQNARAR